MKLIRRILEQSAMALVVSLAACAWSGRFGFRPMLIYFGFLMAPMLLMHLYDYSMGLRGREKGQIYQHIFDNKKRLVELDKRLTDNHNALRDEVLRKVKNAEKEN
jgi:hypothetical protein